jgi:NAD(P)-dependent dehydrogenase (short-subunit alcohol dehydrogenase family)
MYTSFKAFMRISEEEWDRVIDVNLKELSFALKLLLKNMIKNGWGRIIILPLCLGRMRRLRTSPGTLCCF